MYRYLAAMVSLVYSVVIGIRNKLYDNQFFQKTKLPGVCISIGNITLGGTGKSPMLMDITEHLVQHGCSPIVLTRGYKSSLKKNEYMILLAGKILKKNFERTLLQWPDEAMMYSHRLPSVPILVARNRTRAAQWFLDGHAKPTHWILDDGFQHRCIERDFDIVLLDAEFPFGNGRLFPSGSLRESARSLSRAHYIGYTRATADYPTQSTEDLVGRYSSAVTEAFFFDFTIHSVEKQKFFTNQDEPVNVLCGIAQPKKFLTQIQNKGITIAHAYVVHDHDLFEEQITLDSLKTCRSVLTTEKDYWRNPDLFKKINRPCFLTRVRIFPKETNSVSIFDLILSLRKKM
jgi:tetraacyldisaccharide 4'-kinase